MLGGNVNVTTGADVCSKANLVEGDQCGAGREGTSSGEFKNLGEQGAVALNPAGGAVYVGDSKRVQWFNISTGVVEGSFPVEAVNQVEAIAVTSGGEVCLTVNPRPSATQPSPADEVRCYSPGGVLEHKIELEERPLEPTTIAYIWLAADGGGHLFVDEYQLLNTEGLTVQAVFEYGEAGQELGRFLPPGGEAGSREREPGGFALSESAGVASGTLVVSRPEAVVHGEALPPPGPVILGQEGVPGEPASSAALKATVDPEGHSTKYRFEYGTEVSSESATAIRDDDRGRLQAGNGAGAAQRFEGIYAVPLPRGR